MLKKRASYCSHGNNPHLPGFNRPKYFFFFFCGNLYNKTPQDTLVFIIILFYIVLVTYNPSKA